MVGSFSSGEPGVTAGNVADLNWDIREEIIEPSFSSLKSVQGIPILVSTASIIEGESWGETREIDGGDIGGRGDDV